jgi:hypothetical protein
MKKNFILSFFLFFTFNSFSQIIEEKIYDSPISNINIVRLHSGIYYIIEEGQKLKLYSSNHSLYKEFDIPAISGYSASLGLVTDKLYNIDEKIEFLIKYGSMSGDKTIVYNEDNEIVFSNDDATFPISVINPPNLAKWLFKAENQWKMLLYSRTLEKTYVYSLPGTLPEPECCVVSSTEPTQRKEKRSSLSNPYPNPSSEYAKIEFQLPPGESTGEIYIYNKDGIVINKYKVDKTFGYLQLNNSDLPSGMYYYNLVTKSEISDTRKALVIK